MHPAPLADARSSHGALSAGVRGRRSRRRLADFRRPPGRGASPRISYRSAGLASARSEIARPRLAASPQLSAWPQCQSRQRQCIAAMPGVLGRSASVIGRRRVYCNPFMLLDLCDFSNKNAHPGGRVLPPPPWKVPPKPSGNDTHCCHSGRQQEALLLGTVQDNTRGSSR
jgi:hypothetical protein